MGCLTYANTMRSKCRVQDRVSQRVHASIVLEKRTSAASYSAYQANAFNWKQRG